MYNYGQVILHAVYNMEDQKQKIDIDSLRRSLNLAADKSILLKNEMKHLIEKGYILPASDAWILTDYGRIEAARISKAMIRDEFSEKIDRLTKSSAYLDFCEEVYGYRVYLFNMMDKQQIDFILNAIPLTEKDTLLDLGCGSGSILNLLATKYGCQGIGID